jgi:beta-glucosidase
MHVIFIRLILCLFLYGNSDCVDGIKISNTIAIPIKTESPVFPKGFLKGVGLSVYQNGGHLAGQSNWSWFETQKTRLNGKHVALLSPTPVIEGGALIGHSAEFYTKAFDDIKLLKALGVNSFRFSIEWADYEIAEGVFDEEYLNFFERYIDELIAHNIQPMITLYHFVHPLWFEKRGGFSKEKNIHYFVRYCQKVFEKLGRKVHLWCTINEPTVLSACGYVLGIHPPGYIGRFGMAGQVLLNLLNAHVCVYKMLKRMPGGMQAQIGIVHQLLEFEPYMHHLNAHALSLSIPNPLGSIVSNIFTFAFGNQTVKRFLKTGVFSYRIPLIGSMPTVSGYVCNVTGYNPDAPQSYDFIGLNFYSRVIVSTKPTCYPGQVMTDMEYPCAPEWVYDAIVEMSDLGKPIYITENGIADEMDSNRGYFIKTAIDSVHKAVREGYPVKGYFYWTLMDNYEWNDAFTKKFGLYQVNFLTQKRTLRPGGAMYRDYFRIA